MSTFTFNAEEVAPQAEFDLLPAGKYVTQVIESDLSDNSKGTGKILKLTLEILDGEFTNRRLWARLNVQHENPETERIARAQLSALCHSIGITQLKDTTELHGRPVLATVKVRKDKTGQYPDSNDVSGFSAVAGGGPTRIAPTQKPAASAAPPWQRKAAA